MTPPQKKKPSGTTSAKQATKGAKPTPRKRAKAPTKDAAKAAPKGGAKPKASAVKKTATKRTTKKSAAKPAAAPSAVADLEQCAALTTKGTRCRLKPSDETIFCARHQDATTVAPEAAALVRPQKNGKVDAAPTPAKPAEGPAAVEEGPTPSATAKGRAKPVARRPKKEESPAAPEGAPATPTEASEETSEEVPDSDEDEEFVLYASEYSTTLEASPYDDQVSKQIAEGEEDVDLVEEHQMGRGSRGPRHQRAQPRHQDQRQQEQRPRMTQEEAEAKALEKLGPRPEIAPEEDLDEVLVAYDRKFKSEVNHLMGRKRRKRGRRGGRRRGQDGGDGRGGGGGGQGGGRRGGGGGGRGGGRRGGKRRGRGGGQGGSSGGSGGDGGSSGGGGARRGPPKNVARDSPLANNRPSRGPKRAVQPRRRREPDV